MIPRQVTALNSAVKRLSQKMNVILGLADICCCSSKGVLGAHLGFISNELRRVW